jgi:hypothetical protein
MKGADKYIAASFFTCLFVLLIAGCSDRSISPLETSSGTYSVYGALSLDRATNYIRVRNVTIPFLSDSARRLDATVTFEDLQQETSTELEGYPVDFSGNFAHIFTLNWQMQPRRAYRLSVERSDGLTVTSTATTPGITEVELSKPPEDDGRVVADCTEPITFTYKNVKEPEWVLMEVGFEYQEELHWARIIDVAELKYKENADQMFVRMSPRNLLFEVFPLPHWIEHGNDPLLGLPLVRCFQLDTNLVRIRYIHFGPEWYQIDEERRGPVGTLESPDIEGGLGFLGAYHKGSFVFYIGDTGG